MSSLRKSGKYRIGDEPEGCQLVHQQHNCPGNSSHPSAWGSGDAAVVLTNCNTLINDSTFGFNVIANSNAGAVRLTGGEAYINDSLFLGNFAGAAGPSGAGPPA